ncbi:hypothetical protein SMU81_06093, partial [Streptococcus mutans SF14]
NPALADFLKTLPSLILIFFEYKKIAVQPTLEDVVIDFLSNIT